MAFRKIIGVLSIASLGALNLYGMGCSSSTTANPGTADSGPSKGDGSSGTDTSVAKDTGSTQEDTSTGGGDTGGGDAGMTCPDNTPFTALPWAPPTPFGQGACTTAEITTYATAIGAMTFMPPFTSGNATCDACIQAPTTAAKAGPVQLIMMGSTIVDAILNSGGCIANADGNTTATGCGSQFNSLNDCISQECGDCSTSASDACVMAVQGTGVCGSVTPMLTMACLAEFQGASGGAGTNAQATACVTLNNAMTFTAAVEYLAGLWCGPATSDGGTEAGPVEAGPVEAGEQ